MTQSAAPTLSRPQTFLGIQALRGIAACMVVLNHTTELWWVDFGTKQDHVIWAQGASGVDIFFIISGFVMAMSASGRRTPAAGEFLGRRMVRIFPLYWVITLVTLVKLKLVAYQPGLGSVGQHLETPFRFVLASWFLIPYRNSTGLIQPVVSAGWTLSFEMFFYLLFAAALALKVRPARFLTPVLVVLAALSLVPQAGWPAIATLLNPLLLEFLAGVWLGYAVRGGWRLKVPVAALLGVAGFLGIALLPHQESVRWLTWGCSALLLVTAAVMLEERVGPRIPALLLRIGDASYSLYLVHALVVLAAARLFLDLHVARPNLLLMMVMTLVGSVVAALVLFRWVERPLTLAAGRLTGWGAPRVVKNAGDEASQVGQG